jgi:predicted nucleotidyltransferase
MDRDAVIAALRAHEPELKAAGVVRLSLFGSTARDEARPDSDIDLLAAFDEARPLSLLDVIRIENQLADLLGQPVDLIEEGTLRPRARRKLDREAVRAFRRSGSTFHRHHRQYRPRRAIHERPEREDFRREPSGYFRRQIRIDDHQLGDRQTRRHRRRSPPRYSMAGNPRTRQSVTA